jgi:hypothetical protein
MGQTDWIHQYLSQIPIDYIRSYMTSIGKKENQTKIISIVWFFFLDQPISVSSTSVC